MLVEYLNDTVRYIKLTGCHTLTPNAILSIIGANASSLKMLDIAGCWQTTDAVVQFTSQICGDNLIALDLSYCTKISDISLLALASLCPNLRVLRLMAQTKTTSLGIGRLADTMTKLEELTFRAISGVTDGICIEIIESNSKLKSLDLSYMPLTNEVLVSIARNIMNTIIWIKLEGTQVTREGVEDFFNIAQRAYKASHKPLALEMLYLTDCDAISRDYLLQVARRYKECMPLLDVG